MVGSSLDIHFTAKNNSDHKRTVKYSRISVSSKTYDGQVGGAFFKKDFEEFDIQPRKGMLLRAYYKK